MNERDLAARLAAMPEPEPPPAVLERWHAALAELPLPVHSADPGDARPRRRFAGRRLRRAALAVAAGAAGVVLLLRPAGSAPEQPPLPAQPPSALTGRDPTRLGELDDPSRLRTCLSLRADSRTTLLAARLVTWNGAPAVQLVLTSPTLGRLRILTVTPDCGSVLSDATRGR